MVDACAGDAQLAALTLRSELPEAAITEVGDPVALGRAIAAGGWDLLIASDLPPWGDATAVVAALHEAQPRLPAVLLGGELDLAAALRAGFSDYVPKSSEGFLRLPGAVREALGRADEAREQTRLETRLQSLIDEAGVGFFRATLGGRMLEVNPFLLSLLGVDRLTEVEGLELPSPYFRRQDRQALLRRLDERGALHASELELPRSGGGRRWVSLTERLCLDSDGELVVDGLLVDLTARKLAEQELERRAADLDRSNQELQRFAYVASHELQAPLRRIEKFSELLAEESAEGLDDDGRESLGFVREGVERMQQLIDDLLSFSRVESRAEPPRPIELSEVAEEAIADLGPLIEESGAVIELGSLPTLTADRSQMRRLLENLIANAIKFRAEAPPRIELRSCEVEGGWQISVSDNGIGIEPSHRETVFEVFRRLHAEFPGSGIGLAVAKKIVERHGGRIWVEAAPEQGSVFRIQLPTSPAPQRRSEPAAPGKETPT